MKFKIGKVDLKTFMPLKDKILPAVVSVLVAVSGWTWNLYAGHEVRLSAQEKKTAVLSIKKADVEYVNRLEVQLATQTAILQGQSKLMSKQHELLKELVSKE